MNKCIPHLFVISTIFISACQKPEPYESEVYDLSYDDCKAIISDKSNPLWKKPELEQKLTVSLCQSIIEDVEFDEAVNN